MCQEAGELQPLQSLPKPLIRIIIQLLPNAASKRHFFMTCRAMAQHANDETLWRAEVRAISGCSPVNPTKIKRPVRAESIEKLQSYRRIYQAIQWLMQLPTDKIIQRLRSDYPLIDIVLKTPTLLKKLVLDIGQKHYEIWHMLCTANRAGPELTTYAFTLPEIRMIALGGIKPGTHITKLAKCNKAFAQMLANDKELLARATKHELYAHVRDVSEKTGVTFDFPACRARIVKGVPERYAPEEDENTSTQHNAINLTHSD